MQHLVDEKLSRPYLCNADALLAVSIVFIKYKMNHLLNDIRAELLHRKSANVATELPNHCIAESVVIKI
jgi:hypothetical protein